MKNFDQILSKKQLAIVLSQLKENPNPKPQLEQYIIPGELAAEIINLAHISGDIENKTILDLGCGSGRLTIGPVLMEARKAIGVDIDEHVLKITRENVKLTEKLTKQKIKDKIKLIQQDVSEVDQKIDTVIQNPPFGIQNKHADRIFLKKALECGKKVYSLHRSYHKSRKFLTRFIEKSGGKTQNILKYKFRIPHMFRFHEKPAVEYDVDLFVIKKVK